MKGSASRWTNVRDELPRVHGQLVHLVAPLVAIAVGYDRFKRAPSWFIESASPEIEQHWAERQLAFIVGTLAVVAAIAIRSELELEARRDRNRRQ